MPAGEAMQPDNARLRKVLFRDGEPDRVPLFEASIDGTHKAQLLGRPPTRLQDEFEFWAAAGYDHVTIQTGIRSILRPGSTQIGSQGGLFRAGDLDAAKLYVSKREAYAYDGGYTEREWAPEGDGLITTDAAFGDFPWPSARSFDYTPFEIASRELPAGLRVTAFMGWIFTGSWWLMGMERFLIGVYDQPDLTRRVTHRVGEVQQACLEHLLRHHRGCLGAVVVSDDIAYGTGLLVAPSFLRENLFPWYRELCTQCHARELPVVFHSDGKLDEVLQDLVDCGFDALHPIEAQAMDIRAVKRDWGDRLCLLGNIDLAYPLGLGTPKDVRAEVRALIRDCGPGGGLGVGSGNSVPEYVSYANWTAMREATLEFGRYPISA